MRCATCRCVESERKPDAAFAAVRGRVEELRRLEACERALGDAYLARCGRAGGGARWRTLADRHRGHSERLAARIVELGGRPLADVDDQWIVRGRDPLTALLEAEQAALRTYHDHLLDFDPQTMRLVRDRILAEHEETLAELTGERDLLPQSWSPLTDDPSP